VAEVKRRRGRTRGLSATKWASRRTRPGGAGDATSSVDDLLVSVRNLIAENQALTKEVTRLSAILARVTALAGETGVAGPTPVVRRRRRSAGGASDATSVLKAPPRVKQVRRKITDPLALEKRRNALAKARAVRAERLRREG